ncbi:MAG: hypothetical protein DWI22_05810 [Planctomycetota bacterium]|nr:MAG: hypothetical protein DWI22_05810 [Planctomycetota bacterium]
MATSSATLSRMLETMKRLSLGFFLLAGATAMLLFSDQNSNRFLRPEPVASPASVKVFRMALVQHASIPALDDGVTGILAGLAERGYHQDGRIEVTRYNSESDIGTANAIAKEVTSGNYDIIVSASTISLQTIANANRFAAKTPHVFGLVSDPYGAGVDIDRADHKKHPPYLTGYGSIQPVAAIFRTAREMYPRLKSVGLAWNPAEANSLAQTKIAREVCGELGIELVEANAENSAAAREAVSSLIARSVDAIWISGDITISMSSDVIIETARLAKIPVFTAMPMNVEKGALFDLGANFSSVGHSVGLLVADVLDGKSPADIPVENFVPELFLLNEMVPATLRDKWEITENMRQRASGMVTQKSPKKVIYRSADLGALHPAKEVDGSGIVRENRNN